MNLKRTGWELIELVRNQLQVVPQDDLADHELEMAADCWCYPRVELLENDYVMVSHNAKDGRK